MRVQHISRSFFFLLAVIGVGACAGPSTQTPVAEVAPTPEEERAAEVASYEPPVTAGMILRADLNVVLDAGLGRFLQGVDTTAELRDGQFVGFRINRLYPGDERFTSLDLQPGDTVTSVNGQSIERPEHALQVWNSLRVVSQLLIEYQHEGETRELRFEIVDG